MSPPRRPDATIGCGCAGNSCLHKLVALRPARFQLPTGFPRLVLNTTAFTNRPVVLSAQSLTTGRARVLGILSPSINRGGVTNGILEVTGEGSRLLVPAAGVDLPAPTPAPPNAPEAMTTTPNNTSGPKRRSAFGSSSDSPADLASLFECPVCFDYVLPPIFQCQAGHLVCSICRPKLTCCPTCRGPLGNIRNLAMEKVANTVFFPCKYSSNGCGVMLLHTEKMEHEDACEFRPYVCPCPGSVCKWQGSLEQVMPHLMMSHKSITTLQGEDIVFLATDINLPGAVDWVMMQSCFGHHFMLVLEKQDKNDGQQFFAIVQLIGSRKQAEKFAYRLELNGHRRRLTWEATPRSIHEGVASAILNSDCLVFDTSIAQLFAENGNLGINVTISMNHFS